MSESGPVRVVHAYTDLWEYECCGEPLAVGDVVTVDHVPYARSGSDQFAGVHEVDWYVGHHTTGEEEGAARSTVRVTGLWEVRRTLDFHEGPGYYAPRAGSARLAPIVRMRTSDPSWSTNRTPPEGSHDPAQPGGWLMQLEIAGD